MEPITESNATIAPKSYDEHFAYFPYPLSGFQKQSIQAIVDGNHVFTAAPTGSGKTVSAEFAIHHFAVNQRRRVIFTSPIKALSNQKYHDFTAQFPTIKIGLATGDIKVNIDADVVIMTTEILHNYLFANRNRAPGAPGVPGLQFDIDIDRELACVIFDEAHYILDKHRGSVWERTIAMLPEQVQLVMLSATFARPERFAQWVYNRHGGARKVVVASTDRRIVPLQHYAYFATTESIFKTIKKDKALCAKIRASTNILLPLKNAAAAFHETTHNTIVGLHSTFEKYNIRVSETHVINSLLTHLKDNEMLPAICFVFSRAHAEKMAAKIHVNLLTDDSKIPYTAARRCETMIRKLPNHAEYTTLADYDTIVKLAEKGIAFHHSGMIAVFREMVEMLITERFVQVLFCTESFSIGLNCPIRTSIFTDIAKFDGDGRRNLHPHEYMQCAGRAGRRGIDTIGHVVHCSNLIREQSIVAYRKLLGGALPSFESSLQIDIATVLGLLRGGAATRRQLAEYFKGTIMAMDMNDSIETERAALCDIHTRIEAKQTIADAAHRAPVAVCTEYVNIVDAARTTSLKGKKKLDARAAAIRAEYPTVETDARIVLELAMLRGDAECLTERIKALENQIYTDIDRIVEFLVTIKMVADDPTTTPTADPTAITLSPSGNIAAVIAETNGLIVSLCMERTDFFKDVTLREVIVWLSMLVGEKSKDTETGRDTKLIPNPEIEPYIYLIRKAQHTLFEISPELADVDYDPSPTLAAAVLRWVDAETAEECRAELQTIDQTAGDFTKLLLKISALAREIAAAAIIAQRPDFAAVLAGVDARILKYIANAQSLYV